MDARINDGPLSNVQQLEVLEEHSSASYNLDVEALNRLIDFGREHNPRLKGISEAKIAELCEVSETTFKSIRKGRNRKPRVDILYSIVSVFGGSIDRLVGLAPARDMRRERAAWDATLVDGYQQQIAALEKQLAANEAELARLRKRVLEESTARAGAESKAAQLDERCQLRRGEITALQHERDKVRRLNIALTVMMFLVLIAYIVFEFVHIDNGLTGVIRRLVGK